MCMHACLHVYMCPCVQCSGWPAEGVTHPGTGVTSGCETPWSCWPEADPFSPAPYFVICIYLCMCVCVSACTRAHAYSCMHISQHTCAGQRTTFRGQYAPLTTGSRNQTCTAFTLWVLQPALIFPFPFPLERPGIYALTVLPAFFTLLKVFLALDKVCVHLKLIPSHTQC